MPPEFYEVARKIVEMTEGAIFVAHNVRFDYSFLREEFSSLGIYFYQKTALYCGFEQEIISGAQILQPGQSY
jgi:DNA polymerase-3 subunit epsilon